MKRSVGLIIITSLPSEAGNRIPAVVLQRRGRWNMEKMKPESYPRCCQATAHGKLEEGENVAVGLLRESREELGRAFMVRWVWFEKMAFLTEYEEGENQVTIFGLFLKLECLKEIRLLPESGGLDIVPMSEVLAPGGLVEITEEMKVDGCPYNVRAMFPGSIAAVKKAFEEVKIES